MRSDNGQLDLDGKLLKLQELFIQTLKKDSFVLKFSSTKTSKNWVPRKQ